MVPASPQPVRVGPDAVRPATVAVAVTLTAWHAVNAAAIPLAARGALGLAAAIVLAHAAWGVWLVRRPSRRCLLVGGAGLALLLALSVAVLARSAEAPGFAAGVGLSGQLALLGLVLAGLLPAPGRVVRGVAVRAGLGCAALIACVTVAGGTHGHAAPAPTAQAFPPPARLGGPPTPSTTDLLCHLV